MQEVVDAGEVRILQQQKHKKWWRGQWGKSTYEAKWVQEIERHLGGRESSILKQDERKKLLRDMPPPTFRPPLSSYSEVLLTSSCKGVPFDKTFAMWSVLAEGQEWSSCLLLFYTWHSTLLHSTMPGLREGSHIKYD